MKYKHKRTRQQKIIADLRRQKFAYTLENKNLPRIVEPAKHFLALHTSTVSTYSYIKHDIFKTFLLTASIIGFQIILFFLLKNHIIILPKISY